MALTNEQVLAQKRLEIAYLNTVDSAFIKNIENKALKSKQPDQDIPQALDQIKQTTCEIKAQIDKIICAIEEGKKYNDNVEVQIHELQNEIRQLEKKLKNGSNGTRKIAEQCDNCNGISLTRQSFTPVENTTFVIPQRARIDESAKKALLVIINHQLDRVKICREDLKKVGLIGLKSDEKCAMKHLEKALLFLKLQIKNTHNLHTARAAIMEFECNMPIVGRSIRKAKPQYQLFQHITQQVCDACKLLNDSD